MQKNLIVQYKVSQEPPGTIEQQVRHAMKLYHSSFHPDTGELQNVFGRMSFQVPGGMAVTGAMLTFYKSVPQVVFWQWFNQSFNALVNFTNRNAESPISTGQLGTAYVSATFSALATAVGLKKVLERAASPFFLRFIPFLAVAAANCVNVPLMRQTELIEGVDLRDENGNKICKSKSAAFKGIGQVVFSRNVIMSPGMLVLPFIMQFMEHKPWFAKRTVLHAPFQVFGVGCFLLFMVPIGCAIYPQICEIQVEKLQTSEPEAFKKIVETFESKQMPIPEKLYFNKGL